MSVIPKKKKTVGPNFTISANFGYNKLINGLFSQDSSVGSALDRYSEVADSNMSDNNNLDHIRFLDTHLINFVYYLKRGHAKLRDCSFGGSSCVAWLYQSVHVTDGMVK